MFVGHVPLAQEIKVPAGPNQGEVTISVDPAVISPWLGFGQERGSLCDCANVLLLLSACNRAYTV